MLFTYQALDSAGNRQSGTVDAVSMDVAISSLQRRGLVVSSVTPADEGGNSVLTRNITWFEGVSNREVVILSRQISTLFEAQVSALRVFRLLAAESDNPLMQKTLAAVGDDLQSGSPISKALGKHPKVFSNFYVNMVKAGEEAGKLDQTFSYLADYLDRSYEVSNKVRNAMTYPAFVIVTFTVVMILMMTMVIPRISTILTDAGQAVPVYTRVVIAISNFFVNYGVFLLILLVIGGFFLYRSVQSGPGRAAFDKLKLAVPYVGELFRKLYLARISDNLSTMLASGISMVQAIEIAGSVVGNETYEEILVAASNTIKGGGSVSDALGQYEEIPRIMTAMIKIGEETGELGNILKTLARFYQREVTTAIDTLVDLIEPVMIVTLALGVGVLLASVLIPIYNISSAL